MASKKLYNNSSIENNLDEILIEYMSIKLKNKIKSKIPKSYNALKKLYDNKKNYNLNQNLFNNIKLKWKNKILNIIDKPTLESDLKENDNIFYESNLKKNDRNVNIIKNNEIDASEKILDIYKLKELLINANNILENIKIIFKIENIMYDNIDNIENIINHIIDIIIIAINSNEINNIELLDDIKMMLNILGEYLSELLIHKDKYNNEVKSHIIELNNIYTNINLYF